MRVKIPRTAEDDDAADGDTPPWERDVAPGWHAVTVREAVTDKWHDGSTSMLTVTYRLTAAPNAWVTQRIDLDEEKGRATLGRVARACGLQEEEVDTDELEGCELEVRVAHGGDRDKPPGHWINVVGWRVSAPAGAEDMQF